MHLPTLSPSPQPGILPLGTHATTSFDAITAQPARSPRAFRAAYLNSQFTVPRTSRTISGSNAVPTRRLATRRFGLNSRGKLSVRAINGSDSASGSTGPSSPSPLHESPSSAPVATAAVSTDSTDRNRPENDSIDSDSQPESPGSQVTNKNEQPVQLNGKGGVIPGSAARDGEEDAELRQQEVNELIKRYATVEQVRREYVAPDIFDYLGELRAFIESDGASNSGSAGASRVKEVPGSGRDNDGRMVDGNGLQLPFPFQNPFQLPLPLPLPSTESLNLLEQILPIPDVLKPFLPDLGSSREDNSRSSGGQTTTSSQNRTGSSSGTEAAAAAAAAVPRFFCPLDARPPTAEQQQQTGESLPRLLFLPGVDGIGCGLKLHHKSLGRLFEMTCLHIPLSDRTDFQGLLSLVEAEVLQEHEQSPSRPLFLVGESFGALLAAAVAARNPSLPITLVLINSATSFPRSSFQPLIPLLKSVPSEAYSALPFLFSLAIVNPIRIASGGLPLDASLLDRVEKLRDNLLGLIPSLPLLTELLPQATLEWKLHLLETGSAFTEPLLSSIRAPTLIIAGSDDQLLPSKEEAARLQEILTRAKARTVVRVFEGSGHALLLESGFDLASTIKGAHMYIQRRGDDPVVSGFQPPTVQELARAKSGLDGFLRRFCSPVFLSTVLEESPSNAIAASESSSNGGRHNGTANKEASNGAASNGAASNGAANNGAVSNGAAINRASGNGAAVSDSQNGNASSRSSSSSSSISTEQHQKQQKQQQEQQQRQQKQQQEQQQRQRVVVGLEGLPACERPLLFVGNHQTLAPEMSVLVSELMAHGVVVRGLAHPLAIEMFHDINMLVEQGEQYKVFGAVPVTPANTYKVLANKEAALLFPGGVREALKKRGEDYQLFWPERAEFVRMAAKHEATIIPFACIGVDDGFDILVDADEMPSVPVIGPMAVEGVQAWPRVRDAAAAGAAAEQFIPPVVVPKGLNRLYFLFGAPIRTKGMKHLLTDKAAAAELYAHVKGEVEGGLQYLLKKREEDPYNDPVPRLLYEATWGGEKQAPTFKP